MRWIYHLTHDTTVPVGGYAPPSLAAEGFVHGSYRDAVRESARLYFPADRAPVAWQIDPRRLDVPVDVAATPRGPMPHLHGVVPADAVRAVLPLDALDAAPDVVTGHRIALVAFQGMTLLDLVGALDPLARLRGMGFDPDARCEVVSADVETPWSHEGASVSCARVRPDLGAFDLLVIPGGPGARALAEDPSVIAWLKGYPDNRLAASVCTGALLLGAMGRLRGRRATTHASAMDQLPRWGATPVDARVVRDGNVITAGGVTHAIDLGLHLARTLTDDATADRIATQMAWTHR
jgi:cyclohexyl-isocyanide hydratase